MNLITIDFETYYDQRYSLTKISTEEYVRDNRFETIGFAYKINDERCVWVTGTNEYIQKVLDTLPWEDSLVLAHNTMFDGAILSWRYGVKPKGWLDTMSMGRALHGVDSSLRLAAMAERYGVGVKGTEVDNAIGVGREFFSPDALARYGAYCRNDVQLTYNIFQLMMGAGFPKSELKLIDLTLSMFIDPVLQLDTKALGLHLEDTASQKQAHLVSALKAVGKQDLAVKHILGDEEIKAEVRKTLMSNNQFAEMQTLPRPTRSNCLGCDFCHSIANSDSRNLSHANFSSSRTHFWFAKVQWCLSWGDFGCSEKNIAAISDRGGTCGAGPRSTVCASHRTWERRYICGGGSQRFTVVSEEWKVFWSHKIVFHVNRQQ